MKAKSYGPLLAALSLLVMAVTPALAGQDDRIFIRICGAMDGQSGSIPLDLPNEGKGQGEPHKLCHACTVEKKKARKRQAIPV